MTFESFDANSPAFLTIPPRRVKSRTSTFVVQLQSDSRLRAKPKKISKKGKIISQNLKKQNAEEPPLICVCPILFSKKTKRKNQKKKPGQQQHRRYFMLHDRAFVLRTSCNTDLCRLWAVKKNLLRQKNALTISLSS
jgi:hypothetical protein